MSVKKEAVRLPGILACPLKFCVPIILNYCMPVILFTGMISMEPEEEGERLRNLRMNVPLQIFVDTGSGGSEAKI